jgi:hypothetical protein
LRTPSPSPSTAIQKREFFSAYASACAPASPAPYSMGVRAPRDLDAEQLLVERHRRELDALRVGRDAREAGLVLVLDLRRAPLEERRDLQIDRALHRDAELARLEEDRPAPAAARDDRAVVAGCELEPCAPAAVGRVLAAVARGDERVVDVAARDVVLRGLRRLERERRARLVLRARAHCEQRDHSAHAAALLRCVSRTHAYARPP